MLSHNTPGDDSSSGCGIAGIECVCADHMKRYFQQLKIFLTALIIITVLSSYSQTQITHTVSKENISCNYDCTILDVAELNNNPFAVLFVTPVLEKGININPHTIGAYYFKTKWHILNLDGKAIPVASKFTVEYFTKPDETHFQYSFTRADIQADGSAFIDNWHLNNNPTVRFTSFPSWNPAAPGAITNREEITVQYNPAVGKWFVINNNNKPITARVTYNIAITWPGRVNTQSIPRTSTEIKELTVTPSNNSVFGSVSYMYMTAWADGIKLPGDNIRAAHLDKTEVSTLEMEATNLSVRKNTYGPVTIKIFSGYPMGLPLLNAFIKKQSMVFTIDAITTDQKSGNEVINYTIKLTGAYISSYKQMFDKEIAMATGKNQSVKGYDEIKISFTKIEYTNTAGATVADNQ